MENNEINNSVQNKQTKKQCKKGGLYADIKMPLKAADFLVLSAAGALALCLFATIFSA